MDDDRKRYCMKFVAQVANSFPREYPRIGILNFQDLIQYGYLGLLESWNKVDWDRVYNLPEEERQPLIWRFIKNGIKYKILHGISANRDTVRIPQAYHIKWHDENSKYSYNMDIFLSQTFSSFFNADYIEYADDGGNYTADVYNEILCDLMLRYLTPTEYKVIKMFYGIDEPYDVPASQKKIASECSKSISNIQNIKHRALKKMKSEEFQNKLKFLIENDDNF